MLEAVAGGSQKPASRSDEKQCKQQWTERVKPLDIDTPELIKKKQP